MSNQTNKDQNFQLVGRRVILRPFADSNITHAYLNWLRNRELMKFSNQRFRSHSIETCRDYLASFKDTDNQFFAIYHGDEFVGSMTAYVSQVHKMADMGLLIGVQGKGFGSDAWGTLMEYLFQSGMRKVTGGTLRCNAAMVKIMLNSGMNPDGIRISHELVDGKPEDILYFSKFSS